MILMQGKGVSKGVIKGKLYFFQRVDTTVEQRSVEDVEVEKARVAEAQEKSIAQMEALAEKCREEAGDEAAVLFETHAMFVEDEDFVECIMTTLDDEQCNAEYAVQVAGEQFAAMFAAMDDAYMQARAADIKDVTQCVLDAQERGVIFELSHGTNAYSYDTAEAAWKAGFFVDTVCSDIHGRNVNGPVFSPGVIYTKVRGLTGKPWWWILNKAIAAPVHLQNIPEKATEIQENMPADLTIFKIESGEFTYLDSKKESRTFSEKITPSYTCFGKDVYPR